ncbi:MAG: hypothetical protein P8X79_13170 [Reinekea sp.]
MIPLCFPKIGGNLWVNLQFLKINRNQALALCIHLRSHGFRLSRPM